MNRKPKKPKSEVFEIANCIFQLEQSRGHLKWKISDVARSSGVQRSAIYYYFGKNKQQILDSSIELLAASFYGVHGAVEVGGKPNLIKSIQRSREVVLNNPSILSFNFKWRSKKSEIRNRLIEHENGFRKRLAKQYSQLDPSQIEALHAIYHGASTSPFLTENGLACLSDLISRIQAGKVRMKRQSEIESRV